MATPENPLTEEETSLQMRDSPVKKLQEKLAAKIRDLGNRVKETGTCLRRAARG